MAVSNTLLLEKRVVADWDKWNSLQEGIHNSAVLFHTKNYIAQEKVENFKETVSFHLASNHLNYLNQMYFHISTFLLYLPGINIVHNARGH